MNVSAWLERISAEHPVWMDLGLARIHSVANRLVLLPFPIPVITVTGTNGKGSCVAGLAAIYAAAGLSVGVFQSPHLYRVNEMIQVDGQDIADADLVAAFAQIHAVKGTTSLTLFEYFTLAALSTFRQRHVDLVLLEVGLGGARDAVNIVDASLAVVTTIGLDHQTQLGRTRSAIAREKAGIFRPGIPVVCGDPNPPAALMRAAKRLGCVWVGEDGVSDSLPPSGILPENLRTVLRVVRHWQSRYPVSDAAIQRGIAQIKLPGRLEEIPHPDEGFIEIRDVGHNPDAMKCLAARLPRRRRPNRTHVVFSMLGDKDIEGCLRVLKSRVDRWYVAPISPAETPRAASLERLRSAFEAVGIPESSVQYYPDLPAADAAARAERTPDVTYLGVSGSFYTHRLSRRWVYSEH